MPAIQPERLRKDVAGLLTDFGDPAAFDTRLHDLLDFYADRAIRPAQTGLPETLLPAFKVPKPVMRAIQTGMQTYAGFDHEAALRLADRLWARPWFEYRLLAVHLLACVGTSSGADRIWDWLQQDEDAQLRSALFSTAAAIDQKGTVERLAGWLESGKDAEKMIAMDGMSAVASVAEDAMVPALLHLYGRILESRPWLDPVRVHALTRVLLKRSPTETIHLLKQTYFLSAGKDIARLLRDSLDHLPAEERAEIAAMMKEAKP